MAKQTLPTNYQDDVMSSSAEGMRKYLMIYNPDNTVSFKDVTPYDLEGTDFGAGDINRTNEAVNQSLDKSKVIDDITAITAITQTGYASGALALKNVNSRLGGNAITYDESEDAYYIQHGADSASKKKLGSAYKGMIFTTSPVDMKQYTDKWDELTNADFVAGGSYVYAHASIKNDAWESTGTSLTPTFSYNATTGQLTFNPSMYTKKTEATMELEITLNVFVAWLGTVNGEV